MSDASDCSHPIGAIYTSTVQILRYASWLALQKATLTKQEFKELINKLGWNREEKRYLKVDEAFGSFLPEQLAAVEPRTIFQIAENLKKYQSVITKISTLTQITQNAVRGYMQQCRKQRAAKTEKESNIWKKAPGGGRFFEISMFDDSTGVILQEIMESEGRTAQSVLSEALQTLKEKRDGHLVSNPLMFEETLDSVTENKDSAPTDLETFNDVAEAKNNDEDLVINDSLHFEPILEKDNIEDYNFITSTIFEIGKQSPVDILIETFQSAHSWEEISEVIQIHDEYEQEAWEALTPLERRRVNEIMPIDIQNLYEAKHTGKIISFRQVNEHLYKVQYAGCLSEELVSKSRLKTFLMQLV